MKTVMYFLMVLISAVALASCSLLKTSVPSKIAPYNTDRSSNVITANLLPVEKTVTVEHRTHA